MQPMQQRESARITFVGGGNMARALIAGLIRQGVAGERIRVGEPDTATGARLRQDLGVAVSTDNDQAAEGADLLVLAVKPQQAAGVLRSLHSLLLDQQPLLLSIAAGLRLDDLARVCPPNTAIVRAMPNRPALLGAGVTGLYAAGDINPSQRELAELIGRASGRAVWLRAEAELDIVTALSGSGPAYFFLLAEEMARAAEQLGLEPQTAQLLAAATLHGAGMLAREPTTLAEQRAAVTSKGGTTEAALRVLERGGLERLVTDAIRAAAARSAELAGALSAAGGGQ
jgi:pyrroline-5-carboxylate reductase